MLKDKIEKPLAKKKEANPVEFLKFG